MKKLKPISIRSKRQKSNLTYGLLEARNMLSADLDPARNLIVNGDFETDNSSAFFAFADGNQSDVQEIRIVTVTTDHGNIAELDSVAGQMDSIAQDVITTAGELYIISFDLRGRPIEAGDPSDTNDVEVLFDSLTLGRFTGIDRWQTISISAIASGDLAQLEFREASAVSDGKGILLDHISVAGVSDSIAVNGSFEEVDADVSSGIVNSDELPGFHVVEQDGMRLIGVRAVGDASDGQHVLNLNTSDARLDRVFQNIRGEAWSRYFVTFDLRNGDATETEPANLRLRWNNEFAGSFFGTSQWQRYGTVLQATSEYSTLLFRESAAASGSGPQIDNIKIYRIDSLPTDFLLDLNGAQAGTGSTATFIENGQSTLTTDDLLLTFSNGSFLSSATARVLDFSGTEQLQANTQGTGIVQQFDVNTGILRLVGRSSVNNYRQVLRSLTYQDSSDDIETGIKRVVVSVSDGTAASEQAEILVNVFAVNDPPVATPLGDIDLPLYNTMTLNVQAVDPDDTELTYAISISGNTSIFGGDLPTISSTGQIELTASWEGVAEITVTVSDPAGLESTFTFVVEAIYELPTGQLPGNFVPFSGQRQLSNTTPSLRNNIYSAAPAFNIDTSLNYQAVIDTADGEIRFELFAAQSPLTVNNFINLAEDGFFDGISFHRVIDDFVAQGGDPTGTGSGGPGYQFADELNNGLEFESFGQLAMANSGPNTNGSQFFFTLNENPAFAGQHTIFGRVIAGEDVLRAVNLTNAGVPEIIRRVRIEIV